MNFYGQRILFVGAHPDDIEIGCGALLAHISRKSDAELLCATISDNQKNPKLKNVVEEHYKSMEILGIGEDEIIGDFGYLGGGASGSEIDMVDPMLGTPVHALVVASSEGHSKNTLIVPDEIGFHHCAMDGVQSPIIRADMTFFETPGGGAVFSVGSIAWGASLPHNGYDNNVSRISGNVVRRFLDSEPFAMPG